MLYIIYVYMYIYIYFYYIYINTLINPYPSAEFERHKSPTSPVAQPSCSCFDGVAHLHG